MTPPAGRETGWAVWKRWCSVCGQQFAHVYEADCEQIQCKCGAWLTPPSLMVFQGTKQEAPSVDGASLKSVAQLTDVNTRFIVARLGGIPMTIQGVEDEIHWAQEMVTLPAAEYDALKTALQAITNNLETLLELYMREAERDDQKDAELEHTLKLGIDASRKLLC